jgi:hypothetical protein
VPVRLAGSGPVPLLLAPGAGAGQDNPLNSALRTALAGAGLNVASFDYPYTAEGRSGPDPPATLLGCHRAAAAWLRERAGTEVALGGRSMGGRIASLLAAEGEPCRALVLYAYPLHPAGRPDRLRVEHLSSIEVPVLSFVGTRDALCNLDLYDRWVRPLRNFTTVLLHGADHGWRARGGKTEDIIAEVATRTADFLSTEY